MYEIHGKGVFALSLRMTFVFAVMIGTFFLSACGGGGGGSGGGSSNWDQMTWDQDDWA